MVSARILLVSADPADLAFLTNALSGAFPLLAANSLESALRLIKGTEPCGLAFCQMPASPKAGKAFADALRRACPGLAIIALAHGPCAPTLVRAAAAGGLHGICRLPMPPDILRDRVRHLLAHRQRQPVGSPQAAYHLTREEMEFLLGPDRHPKTAGPQLPPAG